MCFAIFFCCHEEKKTRASFKNEKFMGLRRRFDTTQIIIEKALKLIFHLWIDFLPLDERKFPFRHETWRFSSSQNDNKSTFDEKQDAQMENQSITSSVFVCIESIVEKEFQFRVLLSVMRRMGREEDCATRNSVAYLLCLLHT
jgi:hypothetical protein